MAGRPKMVNMARIKIAALAVTASTGPRQSLAVQVARPPPAVTTCTSRTVIGRKASTPAPVTELRDGPSLQSAARPLMVPLPTVTLQAQPVESKGRIAGVQARSLPPFLAIGLQPVSSCTPQYHPTA